MVVEKGGILLTATDCPADALTLVGSEIAVTQLLSLYKVTVPAALRESVTDGVTFQFGDAGVVNAVEVNVSAFGSLDVPPAAGFFLSELTVTFAFMHDNVKINAQPIKLGEVIGLKILDMPELKFFINDVPPRVRPPSIFFRDRLNLGGA